MSDPEHPVQAGIVNLGKDAGPHMLALTDDDKRLVVSDYFPSTDGFGRIHFEGDHHVRVIKVSRKRLALDRRFDVDLQHRVRDGARAAGWSRDEVGFSFRRRPIRSDHRVSAVPTKPVSSRGPAVTMWCVGLPRAANRG